MLNNTSVLQTLNKKIYTLLFISLSIGVLSACSTVPQSLQVAEHDKLTAFADVRASIQSNQSPSVQGQLARWGGVIAKVTNNANDTMLEIVNFPLTGSSRPKQKDETQGRFRVYYAGLLDPVIYKEGRSITALGVVSTAEAGKIGEHEYLYPVLKASAVHLWKDIKQIDVRITHNPFWHTPSYWHYPSPIYHQPVVINRSPQVNKSKTK